MEKLFLSTFLTCNELNIIDKQNVNLAVFVTELLVGNGTVILDGFYEFVGNCFGSDIHYLLGRILR